MIRSILFILMFFLSGTLLATEKPEEVPTHAGLTTVLGDQVDLGLEFYTAKNEKISLSKLLSGSKPVILTPVYYGCPRLCGLVLQAFTKLLNNIDLKLGDDFEVVTVSFDSTEKPDLAAERGQNYHQLIAQNQKNPDKWHFLVGEEPNVAKLMKQIGFHYVSDKGEFAHSAVIMVLSPAGKISQYFTDINFSPSDVKLALVEASQGKIGSLIDHFLLFCYRFDPTKGKYTLAAWRFIQIGVFLCVIISITFVYRYVVKK